MIVLSQRLQLLLSEISGDTCADIGCDHGKLIVSALVNNKIKVGYAIDISPESLSKTKQLCIEENVLSKIILLCGDGGSVLPEKVDTAVIAGMGGHEIVHILKEKDFAAKYILSPHQDAQILRKYLAANDFFIEKDYIIFDKKYYPIIVAVKDKSNYAESEMFFGKNIPPTDQYRDFILFRKKTIQAIIDKTQGKLNPETASEWREIEECCKKI